MFDGDLPRARDYWTQALEAFTEIGVAEADDVRARLGITPGTRTPTASCTSLSGPGNTI
ncbi:hypothetical protein [Streptomyces sp. NPDC002133]|uniref:hypothetical protein n=1 Tax=Streptomyces sp. NPDC002133 TaxID=3154409 RepID=UPI003321FF48